MNHDRIDADGWSGRTPEGRRHGLPNLQGTWIELMRLGSAEYIEARSSACYQVSKKLAARMNVDMERAKTELEEHRLVCTSAIRLLALLRERDASTNLRELAA